LSAYDLSRQIAADERTVERELAALRGENRRAVRVLEVKSGHIRICNQQELVTYGLSRGRSLDQPTGG
jgi:hypothetical protein